MDRQFGLAGWDNGSESRSQKYNINRYKAGKKPRNAVRQRKICNTRFIQTENDFNVLYFEKDRNSCLDAEDCKKVEEEIEYVRRRENFTLKDFLHSPRNSAKIRATDHDIRDRPEKDDRRYSTNRASSETVTCFPKQNVIQDVPLIHRLLDEVSYSEHKCEGIMTPTTALTEEREESKYSLEKSSADIFDLKITECSIEKQVLEQEFRSAYVEGQAYPRCFAIFLNRIDKAVKRKDNIVVVAEVKNDMKTIAIESGRSIDVPVQLRVFNAKSEALDFIPKGSKSKDPFNFISIVRGIMNLSPSAKTSVIKDSFTKVPEIIQKFAKWKTRSVKVSEAFDAVFDSVVHNDQTSNASLTPTLNYVQFEEPICLVCYTKLSPPNPWDFGSIKAYLRPDEGAALSSCRHWLCRDCWQHYLDVKMNDGTIKIECPFTNCKNTVDLVTCLSFSSHANAIIYLKNRFESEVQTSSTLKWCPGCESAAVCENFTKRKKESMLKDIPFVSCYCKTKWCFSCQAKPHWPASCEAYNEYQEMRNKHIGKLFDESGRPYQTAIEVKPCPFCNTPIDKNNGCNYMACRCGKAFCWNCGKLIDGHYYHDKCFEKKVKTHVFSSLDVYSDHGWSSPISKAVEYQVQSRHISRIKTKLGLEKGREPGSVPLADSSKSGMLRKAFELQKDCCSILECAALVMLKSKSTNFNRRVRRFFNRIDCLLKDFSVTLGVKKVEKVNYSKLLYLINATQESMLSLKEFGL